MNFDSADITHEDSTKRRLVTTHIGDFQLLKPPSEVFKDSQQV